MTFFCKDSQEYLTDDIHIKNNLQKTKWVLFITLVTMISEIVAGYWTGSVALQTDGWHMVSHAGALILAFMAYKLGSSYGFNRHFSFGAGKFIPLGGFTSAIILAVISCLVIIESVCKFSSPMDPDYYGEAIIVAVFGLGINLVSAWILRDQHNPKHCHAHAEHAVFERQFFKGHAHDLNMRSTFLHILADAVTSVCAILSLLAGKYYHWVWLDPMMGIVGSCVILSWAFTLLKATSWELLDGHAKTFDWQKAKLCLEAGDSQILDLHVWRVAPLALACELKIETTQLKGGDYYRKLLSEPFQLRHMIIEETLKKEGSK